MYQNKILFNLFFIHNYYYINSKKNIPYQSSIN
nr:MAG TPA: hypothetical protein [Caudoviricetes sp.]